MRVSLAYALPKRQFWLDLELPESASVISAINQSGILSLCPEIRLDEQKVGIFGRFVTLETLLTDGDRVEIYRPITWVAEDDEED